MNEHRTPRLTGVSKTLRKNMTKEERHLWYDFLKDLEVTVNRQKVIGEYVVDFYCASARILIELDGSQHFSENGELQDRVRDEYLCSLGLTVVRYSNLEVHRNFRGVCGYMESYKHLTTAYGGAFPCRNGNPFVEFDISPIRGISSKGSLY